MSVGNANNANGATDAARANPDSVRRTLRDRVAIWLSAACALHCLVTPLLLFLLPQLGNRLSTNLWVEISVLAFILVLGGSSIRHAWVHHGSRFAPALFVLAFTGLCVLQFLPEWRGEWILHATLALILALSLIWPHLLSGPHHVRHPHSPGKTERISIQQESAP